MKKKTILIFGVSSFVGSNLGFYLKKNYRVIGTYFNNPVDLEGIFTIKCDVNNKDIVQKIIVLFKPDITIYCAGLRDLVDCEEFPKLADALNTAGVFNVSQVSEAYKSKFIYLSSCYVFTGHDIEYRENDSPMPLSNYGQTVAAAEFYIQKSCLNYLIFRCAPILGRSFNSKDRTWLETIEHCRFKNEKIAADTKIYTGFIDIWSLTSLITLAIELNTTNRLFQVSSPDVLNRYEFATLYMDVYGGNPDQVIKSDWKFPKMTRALSLVEVGEELFFKMSVFNLESEFDVEMPTIREMIEKIKKTYSFKSSEKKKSKSKGITYI